MVDRDGNPTHAVFGFARFIGDLIERVRPRHMAVAFDQRLPNSYRSRIYPAYKANRDPHPVQNRQPTGLARSHDAQNEPAGDSASAQCWQ